ncbi:fibronectin-like [Patiria miniata]|uniref:Uncharacterized protein n=1 Tax=Patiria miniata TaxID=46514 RepID=A0A913ZB35_PATMI|nr:fibronectin-like [Patiria miniata]
MECAPGKVVFCLLAAMSSLMVMVRSQELMCPSVSPKDTDDKATADVTWTDPSGGGLSGVTCLPASGSPFPIGITTVTCTAQNTAGNTVMCTFWVTVNDNQRPEFTKCPEPIRRTIANFQPMDSLSSLAVTWEQPSTKDNAPKPAQLSNTHESGTEFDLGSTSVKYTVRDDAGNTASQPCSFDVRVVVQPPNDHIFAKDLSTNGFTVVWPQSEDEAVTDYNLLIWKDDAPRPDSSQRIPVTPSDDDRKYTYIEKAVGDLEPAVLYNVEVSSESGTVISLIQQWTRPMSPTNLEASTISPSSVELSWTASPGNVEQYRIITSTGINFYVPKETESVTLEYLDPRIQLSGYVRAVVGSGKKRLESDYDSESFMTGPVNDSQLIAYDYTESTIRVVWKHSSSTSNSNEPYMLLINPPDAEKNYLTVFESTRGEFKGLKPNTEYQIRLISNLGLSLGTSQKTRPGRVSNLRPTAVANASITLEWDPPAEGAVTSYEVKISPAGTQNNPAMESDTSRVFVGLKYGTEYSLSVVSVHDGMKSVPQTLMVTAGVTKAVIEPLNQQAIIIGSVLGAFVLVLAIVLGVICLKYRSLKSQAEPALARTGRTNEAVAPDNGYQAGAVQGSDVGVYEVPKTERTPGPHDEYENTVIGQQSAGKAAPKTKPRPNFR